jgi:hypothetical protein
MMDRIGAYHKMYHDDKGYATKVEFFGYGHYLGEEIPPPGITFMGMELHKFGDETPKLQLDNGDIIWGCECVWATEEQMQRDVAGIELEIVSIHDVRGKI